MVEDETVPLDTVDRRDFLDLYLHYVGTSEIPRNFHLWCAMSVMAACVTDQVYIQVDESRTVYPNLYVFMIGPSGSGKGKALDMAYRLIADIPRLNTYAGMATKQAFIDWMSQHAKTIGGVRVVQNPVVYFVTEELAMAMRPGELAHDLITLMTGLFMRPSFPITEGTRGHGFVQIHQACLNWLAGSNEQWLVKSVPKDAMETGFLARVCVVYGERDSTTRYPTPLYPPDYEAVKAHLHDRCDSLTYLKGIYTLTEDAQALHDAWYLTRPEPSEKLLDASFYRADEMVYKFALLLALSEWDGWLDGDQDDIPINNDFLLHARHMEEAILLWNDLAYDTPAIVNLASASPQSEDVLITRDIVKRFTRIVRSELTIQVTRRGLNADRLDRAMKTLLEEETVELTMETMEHGRTRRWYTWRG